MRFLTLRWFLIYGFIGGMFILGACGFSKDEGHYLVNMVDHASRTSKVLEKFSNLGGNPQMDNPQWQSELSANIKEMRNLITEARQFTPPERFAETHKNYMQAMDTFNQMADTYEQANKLHNSEQFRQAQALLNQGKAFAEKAQQQMNTLREKLQQEQGK
jgi:hypothetical protein